MQWDSLLLTMYLSDGGTPPTFAQSTMTTCHGAGPLALSDFNNDSCPDFAVSCIYDNNVIVYINNCAATPGFTTSTVGSGSWMLGLVSADVNNDGRADVVRVGDCLAPSSLPPQNSGITGGTGSSITRFVVTCPVQALSLSPSVGCGCVNWTGVCEPERQ